MLKRITFFLFILSVLLEFKNSLVNGAIQITSVSSVSLDGGQTTLSGVFPYPTPTDFQVYIGNPPILCSSLSISTDGTSVYCTAPANSVGGSYTIYAKVTGETSNTDKLLVYQPIISGLVQTGDQVTITGQGFGEPTTSYPGVINYQVMGIFGISKVISSTSLVFQIPRTSRNGAIKLRYQGYETTGLSLHLTPNISTITPSPLTTGGSITISGDFLSPIDVSGFTTSINIFYQTGLSNLSIFSQCQYISSVYPYLVICQIPTPPQGIDRFNIQITSQGGRSSEAYQVLYQPPTIKTASPLFYGQPGNVTINGKSFAQLASDNKVQIGSVLCTNPTLLDPENIICQFDASVPPPSNGDPLEVKIKSVSLESSNKVFLYSQIIPCGSVNNLPCSGHGICHNTTGFCQCDDGWSDMICSSTENPEVPKTNPNASTEISNFQVNIGYIREHDPVKGQYPVLIDLKDATWTQTNITSNQTLYEGKFTYNPIVIQISLYQYQDSVLVDFAGEKIPMDKNSVKYIVKLSNFTFQSQFNSLEVIFRSKIDPNSLDNCGDPDSIKNITTTQNWIQLLTGKGTILNAKFSNRMFVDTRVYKSSIVNLDGGDPLYELEENSSEYVVLTSIPVNYFHDSCEIDPNFSSLVSLKDDNSKECATKESFAKWKIIVICTVCPVGIVALTLIILKKKQIGYFLRGLNHSIPLKNLK
ncbi:hypothetical protein DLAC_01250 [Tieghemostelium lacteum]|uniref:EGF-like domain-containing protein n=1 Tax=Tieghemostelium lacteum TaxID=361077 RepID=A0A152A8G9_TIELA|nr:hypothetical protein DLAC_01250 [Tieghemostelium lacteum]|eukprot:KYR02411.1 hypothetical protein DLAC_01250 [Tieghemostelium lacteum]